MSDLEPCQFGFEPPCDACLPCVTNAYRALKEENRVLREAIQEAISVLFLECQPNNGDIFSMVDDILRPALAKRPSNEGGET